MLRVIMMRSATHVDEAISVERRAQKDIDVYRCTLDISPWKYPPDISPLP